MSEETSSMPINPPVNSKADGRRENRVKRGLSGTRVKGRPNWTPESKQRAVAIFVTEGILSVAAERTGIPYETLKQWQKKEWWEKSCTKFREEQEEVYRAKAHDIIIASQEVIIDRLKNGDPYIGKNGEVKHKPVSMREATFTYGVTADKQFRSLNKPEPEKPPVIQQPQIQEGPVRDFLMELADKFVQVSKFLDSKQVSGEVVKNETPQSHNPENPSNKALLAHKEHRPVDESFRDSISETGRGEVPEREDGAGFQISQS